MAGERVRIEPRVPVAILGAGLTGMSTAHHLRTAGVACRVFERLERAGGHAVTIEEEGYRFDRTGHLLHVGDDDIRDLALEWIGQEHRWVERRSAVWSHGVYTPYPFQANTHGLPPEVAYACVMGFIEAQRTPPTRESASFEEYCYATFGTGIAEHFMIPYNTRVWGVPPSEISAAWCRRFVPVPTVEDVIAGAVGLRGRELGYNARFVYPDRGIGALADGMARDLGEVVELGREPRAIDLRTRMLDLGDERVDFDVLVSTAPLPKLVDLIADVPAEVRDASRRLRCTHLYYLDVALHAPAGVPYHWAYVPEAKYPFYRVGCYSAFSPLMAPPGKASLYVELVDRSEPDLTALLPEVATALIAMGFIRGASDIAFARLRRIDHAYVVFDHHYDACVQVIGAFLAEGRVITTGRYGAWNYSSMADALAFGRSAAADAATLVGAA